MIVTKTVTWSMADEQRLQELTERKAQFNEMHREPIRRIIVEINPLWADKPVMIEQAVKAWIDRTDAIRDALKPFDSGVRPAPESPPAPATYPSVDEAQTHAAMYRDEFGIGAAQLLIKKYGVTKTHLIPAEKREAFILEIKEKVGIMQNAARVAARCNADIPQSAIT